MEKSKRKFSPVLIVGLVVLIALLAVFGPRLMSGMSATIGPAMALDGRVSELDRLGVSLTGDEAGMADTEVIALFETASWRQPNSEQKESSGIANQLISDKSTLARLSEQAQQESSEFRPSHSDFIERQNTIATKRAIASLKTYVAEATEQKRYGDATTGLKHLIGIQDALIPNPSEASMVQWFSANSEALKLMVRLSEEPNLPTEVKEDIRALISPEMRLPSVKGVAQRFATEMMLLSKHLSALEEGEIETLYLLTDGRIMPDMSNGQMYKAVQSRLAEVWIEILAKTNFEANPEEMGIGIDRRISQWQDFKLHHDSDFMVAAVPLKFELFGRMIARVLQSRAVLNVALDGDFKVGEVTKTMSGHDFVVKVEDDGKNWVLTSSGVGDFGRYNNNSGFEINQGKGIRYFIPKK